MLWIFYKLLNQRNFNQKDLFSENLSPSKLGLVEEVCMAITSQRYSEKILQRKTLFAGVFLLYLKEIPGCCSKETETILTVECTNMKSQQIFIRL
jgi:hypothetical protein